MIIQVLTVLFVFAIGACCGSFLNVCICRIPRGESIVAVSSHCTSCNEKLKPLNLVPVLSYLFQRGKCSNCGEKISPRYMCVEITTAILYVCLFYKYGINIEFFAMALLISILIVMFFIDLEFGIIPNSLVAVAAAGGAIQYISSFFTHIGIYGDSNWWNPILGAFLGSTFFILVAKAGAYIYKTENTIGGGDIKVLFPIGLFLGWKMMIVALFISIVTAAMICVVLIISKRLNRKDTIPFGPFIALGTVITILFGWQIMGMYFH
ncbi:type 4 prepilin-like protein leader peptide-processing enzyme [Ruminiclostridium hungatei]|uniref:Type 4 prepilin-like protein leader peptide-processing enzyme n=1 Tax=Ruminiclostridium hungatei TaxID=48256 RepID=A0A1V4SGG7_RUMHU|nr:A24 family peptidase [Ruminiclostridium hungatei]OPX43022.1 type 4 prepilin-like protein leader peptide-processing enzyme [Ruminiclostridium hungatei]